MEVRWLCGVRLRCGLLTSITAIISPRRWPEAAAISLKRGTDNECADFGQKAADNSDYVKYVDAVKQGFLSEKDVDVTLKRLFTARFRLGLFDPPEMVKYAQIPDSEIDSDAHRQLALRTAASRWCC